MKQTQKPSHIQEIILTRFLTKIHTRYTSKLAEEFYQTDAYPYAKTMIPGTELKKSSKPMWQIENPTR